MFMCKEIVAMRNFTRIFRCGVRLTSSTSKFTKNLNQSKNSLPNLATPFAPYVLKMQKESSQFMQVYDDVVRELCDFSGFILTPHDLSEAEEHFKKALDYNLIGGKKTRMLTVMETCKQLIGTERLTSELIRQACLLGWSLELIQSAFLNVDDIVDGVKIRRGKECWHTLKDVDSIVTIDIMMFVNGAHLVLKRYFGHLPCYLAMMNLLHEITMISYMGESLDVQLSKAGVAQFTMDRFRCLASCKTAYFGFYTTIAFPMLFCGYDLNADKQLFDAVKAITCELGIFYQAQNDFLDCFADATILNKPGADIENGICTWLSTMAMQLGNDEQKTVMQNYYGNNDPECINKIKQLYSELSFPERFDRYEDDTYNAIKQQIHQLLPSSKHLQRIMIETMDRTFNHT